LAASLGGTLPNTDCDKKWLLRKNGLIQKFLRLVFRRGDRSYTPIPSCLDRGSYQVIAALPELSIINVVPVSGAGSSAVLLVQNYGVWRLQIRISQHQKNPAENARNDRPAPLILTTTHGSRESALSQLSPSGVHTSHSLIPAITN